MAAGGVVLVMAAVVLWRSAYDVPAASALRFEPGAMQSYGLTLVTDVRMQVGGDEATSFRQDVSGTLHLRVFDATAEGVELGFQLDPVRYEVARQRDPGIEARLALPFFARFSPTGEPQAFHLPIGIEPAEAMLLEEIVRTFQVTVADGDASSWTAEESHATGRYRAEYERGAGEAILKRKAGYTELAEGFGLPGRTPRVEIEESKGELRLHPRAWLLDATVAESLHVDTEGLESWTRMQGRLELSSTGADDDVALFVGADANAVRMAAVSALQEAQAAASETATRMPHAPADQVQIGRASCRERV